MEWLDTQAMLWFTDRWWWFHGTHISAESQFEWKNGQWATLNFLHFLAWQAVMPMEELRTTSWSCTPGIRPRIWRRALALLSLHGKSATE